MASSFLTSDPPVALRHVAYRFGMLVLLLGLLAWQLSQYTNSRTEKINLAVLMTLIVTHIAFSFKLSRSGTIALRVAAVLAQAGTAIYLIIGFVRAA